MRGEGPYPSRSYVSVATCACASRAANTDNYKAIETAKHRTSLLNFHTPIQPRYSFTSLTQQDFDRNEKRANNYYANTEWLLVNVTTLQARRTKLIFRLLLAPFSTRLHPPTACNFVDDTKNLGIVR